MFAEIIEFLFKYRPVIFEEGQLTFAAPTAVITIVAIVAVAAALALWTYRGAGRARARDRVVLASLRVALLALLVFCLFRPTLVLSTVVPQQNYVGVLIDDSRSMRIADGSSSARSAFIGEAFAPEDGWLLRQLSERFQLRFFRFSSVAERIAGAGDLTFDGARTRIASALDLAREELAPVPVSGLVVLTDGADNSNEAMTESLLALQAAEIPVYAVGLGRDRFEKDIELTRVSTPRTALSGSSLIVDLIVAQSGYAGQKVPLLIEDNGRVVGSHEVELPQDGEPATVRVHFTAESAGPRSFRFRIPVQPEELVLENNEQDALILVRDDVEKVLYFEGEPRYEVKFARRAVEDDESLQLVVLQRTAENKYARFAVDSAQELMGGFPKTRDELFRYRALILGSIEASHFTHEQLRMIADFVSERGGGLLMLGGRRAFAEGGWAGTPVADVLPVELDAAYANDTTFFAELQIEPTPAGLSHEILRLVPDADSSAQRWRTMPPLSTFNRVGELKPGATALLTGTGGGLTQPVLAHQRYGRGQVFTFAVQDSWLWQMHYDIPLDDMTHETLWRQLLRSLVSDVPNQVMVALPDRAAPGTPVRLTAEVNDEAYLKVNNARVTANITSPSGTATEVPAEWTVDRDGEYHAGFTPTEQGLHEIAVNAVIGEDTIAAPATYVDVAESRSEYFGSQMNASLLERMADETGGRYYTPASIASLPEDLSITGKGTTVVEERELWDMPFIFLLLVLLVGAEWVGRRRRGLA